MPSAKTGLRLLVVLLAFTAVGSSFDDTGWKDVQGRTVFRVFQVKENGSLVLVPMTPVMFFARRVEGDRAAILKGDVFQDCYFDTLKHEVDPRLTAALSETVTYITLGLRCKGYVLQVESVGVSPSPVESPRPR